MEFLTSKIKPTRGFAHAFHLSFIALLPLVVLVFVRLELYSVALIVILLSKWRMFAVKPHHWMPHVRTNAVDIVVGLSLLVFMSNTNSMAWQLFWVLVYEVWLLALKPGTSLLAVSSQAAIAQGIGLTSVFLFFEDAPLALYVLLYWFIAYFCARHFLASFDESHAQIIASQWGFFAAALMWVLGHWLLFFSVIAQPAIILSILGYGLGSLYYLQETDRLSRLVKRQIIVVMFTLVAVILAFSDWGDKSI
jgi:hypothetical protein